jgi:hypothetical protein
VSAGRLWVVGGWRAFVDRWLFDAAGWRRLFGGAAWCGCLGLLWVRAVAGWSGPWPGLAGVSGTLCSFEGCRLVSFVSGFPGGPFRRRGGGVGALGFRVVVGNFIASASIVSASC